MMWIVISTTCLASRNFHSVCIISFEKLHKEAVDNKVKRQ